MKPVTQGARHIRNYLVCQVAARPWSRGLLNAAYNRLTAAQKEAFHRDFAQLFRNPSLRGRDGSWEVAFADRSIRIPLASEQFWLDWDTALSVVGQDVEIRQTYAALLSSAERPELFIDIGANYGTHSLLFLVHQIATLSFEPNSSCHGYFRRLCAANQVVPHLEPVALGDQRGRVTLSYPRRETWLGSVSATGAQDLAPGDELIVEQVEQRTLDDYMAQIGQGRILIKIDTEGHELRVLQGAETILQTRRPYVIVECWRDARRADLFDFLAARGYGICQMPWSPAGAAPALAREQFLASAAVNFIAVPMGAAPEGPA